MTSDYLRYYDLESYLFEEVHPRFHREGKLGAFDFFTIIIWKANRAKSTIAHRLVKEHPDLKGLEAISQTFTSQLFEAESAEDRIRLAIKDWRFRLPMASAILTVLWPDEFTVFDVRVYGELSNPDEFKDLRDVDPNNYSDRIWKAYVAYREAVKVEVEQYRCLRDKDRFLWGRSAARQLSEDIERAFVKA